MEFYQNLTCSFTELLTQPVIDFMIKQEFDAEEVIKKRVELIFHDDMPAQRRYVRKIAMTEHQEC